MKKLILLFVAAVLSAALNSHASGPVDMKADSVLRITNGNRQIYGELFTPAGESRGVAIVAHGFNGTHHSGRSFFDVMKELGY